MLKTDSYGLSVKLALQHGVSAFAFAVMVAAVPAMSQETSPQAADDGATDQIVVTGRRAALEAADQRKRRSETIVDSVIADDAGKLPDNSITEVLQRIPGVSIVRFSSLGDPDHFSVQGAGIQVRGLSSVASRLNGREIFSANNGRALLWGDVTPELMSAVDVYKASTADLIEGGSGGQVDLRTRLPFDYSGTNWHFAANAEASMGDLAKNLDPAGSMLVSKKWETGAGEIGILADVAYSRFTSKSQFFRLEPFYRTRIGANDYFVPGGFAYGDERFQRDRTGFYGAVQWAPSPDLTFTGTFFQSRYKNRSSDYASFVTSQSLSVDPATSEFDDVGGLVSSDAIFQRDSATFLPSGSAITSGGNKGAYRYNAVTRDYSLAFKWAGDGPLAISGSLQRVDSKSIVDRLDVFRTVPYPTSFSLDLSGKLPQVSIPQSGEAALLDPSQYSWQASMPHNENNKGRLDSAQLDLEYNFDDSFFRSIKVGGRYAERTERDFNNSFNWAALGAGWNGDPVVTFDQSDPGDIELHTFNDFFRGNVGLPTSLYFPSYDLVDGMDRIALHTRYGGLGGIRQPGFLFPADRTDYRTETLAGYALARFGQEDGGLSGNVGVRVVRMKNESSGYFQQNGSTFVRNGQTFVVDGTVAGVRSGGASFTRFLPSLNFDYALASDIKLRAGYNVTVDNASFSSLRASGNLGVATVTNQADPNGPGVFTNYTIDTGNPELKPSLSHNFDLSFEYYGPRGRSFHLALFHKRIKDSFIYSVVERQTTVRFADGTSETATVTQNDYGNADKTAKITGAEIGGRFFFDMLPGLLSGFGVEANYTYIDSKNPGDSYRDIDGVRHNDVPIAGLSKHNANATLLYEKDPVSFRVAYSWRSKYLMSTNSNGTNGTYPYYSGPNTSNTIQLSLPVYSSSYGSLDAGVRFKITDNFSFSIQGNNLTNATQKTVQAGYKGKALPRAYFQSDRRISTGINLTF